LLYRLKVLHIRLAPLRDRKSDIPLLAATFLERLNAANQTKKYFGPRVLEKFLENDYPGNVRELQNTVERGFYSTTGVVITHVDFLQEDNSLDIPEPDETESWFKDLTEGRQNFWLAVHDRYKRRDLSREKVIALVDFGLRATRGNYRMMASKFHIPKEEYRRFMDFLRRSRCLLDFRPYRRIGGMPSTG
jgi:DNA-binding NtrC family response regulator